jgi:hypothetical protein
MRARTLTIATALAVAAAAPITAHAASGPKITIKAPTNVNAGAKFPAKISGRATKNGINSLDVWVDTAKCAKTSTDEAHHSTATDVLGKYPDKGHFGPYKTQKYQTTGAGKLHVCAYLSEKTSPVDYNTYKRASKTVTVENVTGTP